MKHQLKPLAYMRYGDDWICFVPNRQTAEQMRAQATSFLNQQLGLIVNPKIDVVGKVSNSISFLGVDIWPNGRRLQQKVRNRVTERVTVHNIASYKSLVATHDKIKKLKELDWLLSNDI